MIDRHDLTEEEWAQLAPLLPRNPGRGGRWADHRRTINGILFRTRAGCPWRDLPERYGHWPVGVWLSACAFAAVFALAAGGSWRDRRFFLKLDKAANGSARSGR